MSDVLDVRDAAEYLRINDQTLRRLAREGDVPAFKVGRSWRFKREHLDDWAASQNRTNGDAGGPKRILVADDEEVVRALVSDALRLEGFEVDTAVDGIEAVEQMRVEPADLVFLDLKMPRMNGVDALRVINDEFGPLPVVILTGYPDSDMLQKALLICQVTLLAKPCPPEKIVTCVRTLLHAE